MRCLGHSGTNSLGWDLGSGIWLNCLDDSRANVWELLEGRDHI